MKVTFILYRDDKLSASQCIHKEEHYAIKDRVPPPWRTSVSTAVKYLLSETTVPAVRLGMMRLGESRYEGYLKREAG